jgi:hypothetical protein
MKKKSNNNKNNNKKKVKKNETWAHPYWFANPTWKSEIVKKTKKNLIKLGELANSAIMDIKLG